MKNIKLFTFTCLIVCFSVFSQQNSVLSTGTWYKFAVDKTGVFKLDKSFLESIGVNTNGINPKNIRIYGNGLGMLPEDLKVDRPNDLIENAIKVIGEDDGVFNDSDFVLFYAQGPHTWTGTTKFSYAHNYNVYSDYTYYYLNFDKGPGKRITQSPVVNTNATNIIKTFTDAKFHERDEFSFLNVGRYWYGEKLNERAVRSFSFNFENIVLSSALSIKARFATNDQQGPVNYSLNYNGVRLRNIASSTARDSDVFAVASTTINSTFPTSDNIVLTTGYTSPNVSATSALDYIEVKADRNLIATGKQFGFRNFASRNRGVYEYEIANKNQLNEVWKVTEPTNVEQKVDQSGDANTFKFKEASSGNLDEYRTVVYSNAFTPIKLGNSIVSNQNLHGLTGDIDYLIITNNNYVSEAQQLANFRAERSGLKIKVVVLSQIYNEFSSGALDVTAIRDFIKYIYDQGTENNRLKYVCMFGDASFDYKDRIPNNNNIVPQYHIRSENINSLIETYNSDDYYAFMNTNNGVMNTSSKMDLAIGRLPFKNSNEATILINKIKSYESSLSAGDWKNKIIMIADDEDKLVKTPIENNPDEDGTLRLGANLDEEAKKMEVGIKRNGTLILPPIAPQLNINKLYADAFVQTSGTTGETYEEVDRRVEASIFSGALVVNYLGHGNEISLGNENYVTIPKINEYRNRRHPLFITITCDFSRFDNPELLSGGEAMMLNPVGGAVAMITTTRKISASVGIGLNRDLTDALYKNTNETRTVGDIIKEAKNNFIARSKSRHRFFVHLLGDPTMPFGLPKTGIEITKLEVLEVENGQAKDFKETTVFEGGAKYRLTGNITNNQNFDGVMDIVIFDEPTTKETLLNNGVGDAFTFESLENNFFRGKASVKNGQFSFEFIVPKDVSVNVSEEPIKISMYASNNSGKTISEFNFDERADFNKTYKAGGISPHILEDTTPPTIRLFLDSEVFVDGDVASSTTPELIVRLSDEMGINTSLSGIGHNILLIIDGDETAAQSLNEFYTTEENDFTKGVINYTLPKLSPGEHTLTVKAFDTSNNSAESSLSFVVNNNVGNKLDILKLFNYPNPFINHTEFWITHNKANEPLEAKIQVFSISGDLVKTMIQNVVSSGTTSRSITWDGRDDFGNRLAKGVYVYKVTLKETLSGDTVEKTEKLVIL